MIRFTCPTCQKALKTPDDAVNRKASCPRCGQRLLVPDPVKPAANNKTVVGEPIPDPAG
jgi:DNA-directed RNA polymerase subunit RPC12/RpoP